jgi:hypothetical protein
MKPNKLQIAGKDNITLKTPKGTMAGFRWDGAKLIHTAAGKTMSFARAISEEIEAAVQAARAAKIERKYGYEIKDGDREGWIYSHTANDAHGVYTRVIQAPIIVTVCFAREDLRQ